MEIEFEGEIVFWKGPAPWFFVPVPEDESAEVLATAEAVSYGWGVIPVAARIGRTTWTTSLFPKDGGYLVPVKAEVRQAERLTKGDTVTVRLTIAI